MKYCRLMFLLFTLLLGGCGSDKTSQNGSTFAASEKCIDCHNTSQAISSVTGAKINDEWARSAHGTLHGASCIDCHGSGNGHPNTCGSCHGGSTTAGLEFYNPEKAGMCGKCHNATTGYDARKSYAGLPLNTQSAHFNNMTGYEYPASFVSYNYVNNCRKCHNPHDTSTLITYNKDWSRSGHGTTLGLENPNETSAPIQYDFRNISREEVDFKTAGSFGPASQQWSDNSTGTASATYNSGCLRCHTSTGFINYVKSGFTNLSPFGPADPKTGKPYRLDDYMNLPSATFSALRSRLSSDKTRELTNCDVCHDDGKGNTYNFKLRKVPQTLIYANYSGRPASKITRAVRSVVTFDDAGDSNLCVACHSGRLVGNTIKMADLRGIDWASTGRIVNHFRGAAQMLYQKGGFEFYTSAAMYSSDKFSHRYIGMNQTAPNGKGPFAGDSRGHGPCIGCHLNSNGSDGATSHTFLPVNREASNTYLHDVRNPALPITAITSRACATCHTGSNAWTPAKLQAEKDDFRAAVEAFRQVLAFALDVRLTRVDFDTQGRVPTSSNWYGTNTTGQIIQPWLRSASTNETVPGSGFIDPVDGGSPKLIRKAAYNMGATYNWFMFYYDPGAFAHNPAYAKRLMYDSIDWLDDGLLNSSVSTTFNGTLHGLNDDLTLSTKLGATTWQRAYNYLLAESGGGRPVP
ncbi:lipoprotein cytochrome c, 10 heme-binding sites [Geotalea daltonii FRC-32]|uniref:Lipoprotein cytochrome c, 10 heme-binding sites n=1 Tax=Geotalea daltonii (strain DSM 22248 / JCM 15807 / FRC-32) TaxID=316067 RepID=B9M7D0_GEODF|nr:hypothetical protein [Geotalea daltonii]ACM20218.1 lipoprotein cytochrome c, 10 heme-binding sites [Geotalea daltonii FRC-32]